MALVVACIAVAFGAPARGAGENVAHAVASPRLVYRVTAASEAVVKNHLVVTAQGDVRSGGWTNPRLRVGKSHIPESDTWTIELVATPPRPDDVVSEAITPIVATTALPLPPYATVKLKIEAESNSMVISYR